MKILCSAADLSTLSGPLVLAAGTFDGLHLGHQALLRQAMQEAERQGGTAVVMTFDRHPASITRPEKAPKLLVPQKAKLALLQNLGVPVVLLLEFNPELAAIPAEEFIRSLTASGRLSAICVGSQWSFGRGGEGNITLLRALGEELGFSVREIAPVEVGGEPISSTRIRRAVGSGDFAEAGACLGRPFRLTATVVSGAGMGEKIGFPTANLDVGAMQLPPDGVYAVRVFGDVTGGGVANIGVRPTVDDSATPKRTVEVHLFDQSGDFVGRELQVEFVQFLREEQKFPSLTALQEQIARDCAQAKALLREVDADTMDSVYTTARQLIDTAHTKDPTGSADGHPAELVYADRMEDWVLKLIPEASPLLRLAARCQHLERWRVPRSSYPEGKVGYLSWRKGLYVKQAERAAELLLQAGVPLEEAEEAKTWISKTGLKVNSGTQALEDAAVLVFLENEIGTFATKHGDYTREKFVEILRKSWRKLSPVAQEVAKTLQLPPAIAGLVQEALED